MSGDPALEWLKEHDPEAAKDPKAYRRGYGAPRPSSLEITGSALDVENEDGSVASWVDLPARDDDDDIRDNDEEDEHPADELRDTWDNDPWDDEARDDGVIRPRHVPRPDPFGEALRAELTPDELRHYSWLSRRQVDISHDLGISQPAVAKRERLLIAKLNEIHQRVHGRPYPYLGHRRAGVRGAPVIKSPPPSL